MSMHNQAMIAQSFSSPFDPSRPWDAVWKMMIKHEDSKDWWLKQFERRAFLTVSRTANLSTFIDGDAPVGSTGPNPSGLGNKTKRQVDRGDDSSSWGPATGGIYNANSNVAKKPRMNSGDLSQKGPDGLYTINRTGTPLCPDFQTGSCKSTVKGSNFCSKHANHIHQCARCLRQGHGAQGCELPIAGTSSSKGSNGGGKGKGKKGKPRRY